MSPLFVSAVRPELHVKQCVCIYISSLVVSQSPSALSCTLALNKRAIVSTSTFIELDGRRRRSFVPKRSLRRMMHLCSLKRTSTRYASFRRVLRTMDEDPSFVRGICGTISFHPELGFAFTWRFRCGCDADFPFDAIRSLD